MGKKLEVQGRNIFRYSLNSAYVKVKRELRKEALYGEIRETGFYNIESKTKYFYRYLAKIKTKQKTQLSCVQIF